MTITPEVLWAQRSNITEEAKNVLFLTIRIPDSVNAKVSLTKTSLSIESDSEDSDDHYKLDIEFFKEVDPENSHHTKSGNAFKFVIRKAEMQEEFWPRLTKEKVKYHYIKTDFDKWVDEDEQEEKAEDDELAGMGGMPNMGDMGAMGGMPGMPGMGGMGDMPDMGGMGGPGGFNFEDLAKENPQLNKLRDANGQFDFSKLQEAMGGDAPGGSEPTDADFSSSDEEADEDELDKVE